METRFPPSLVGCSPLWHGTNSLARARAPEHRGLMPRFAANLSMLFTERPFLERFGAAAAAGFRAVEVQEPYEVSAAAIRAELDRHRLTMLGLNTARGAPGELG